MTHYVFKRAGFSPPGAHCTYCPMRQNEPCTLACEENYLKLEAERARDGVKVTDVVP